MAIGLWGFLSVCVIFGTSFVFAVMYLAHQKSMKQLELEELKLRQGVQNPVADQNAPSEPG